MGKLKKIFASVLNITEKAIIDDLSPQNTPSWDSLNAIVLVSEVEKAYKIKFSYDEVMAFKDFKSASQLLKNKGKDPSE